MKLTEQAVEVKENKSLSFCKGDSLKKPILPPCVRKPKKQVYN